MPGQRCQQLQQFILTKIYADAFHNHKDAFIRRDILKPPAISGISAQHMVSIRLGKVSPPFPDDFGKIQIVPEAALWAAQPLDTAVQPAAKQYHHSFGSGFHLLRQPPVINGGPHSHIVSQPFRFCLSVQGEALPVPNGLRGRVMEKDTAPAYPGFSIERYIQGF